MPKSSKLMLDDLDFLVLEPEISETVESFNYKKESEIKIN